MSNKAQQRMKVLLEFKDSHHYLQEYQKTELFCPNCGQQTVWEDQGPGDFYVGADLACSECLFIFTMPSGSIRDDDWAEIPKQLKTGVTNKPTTQPGR